MCVHIHRERLRHTHTHTHNGILLSHKKEQNNAICTNMDGPGDYHTKWSNIEQHKYMISIICRIEKENIQMNLFKNQKQTHKLKEWTCGYQGGSERG